MSATPEGSSVDQVAAARPYVNTWGIQVRGYESAMGGLYKSEAIALEVSDGVGPCHALVRFVDVYEAYEALDHILRFDCGALGAIGESLLRGALQNRRGAAAATGEAK